MGAEVGRWDVCGNLANIGRCWASVDQVSPTSTTRGRRWPTYLTKSGEHWPRIGQCWPNYDQTWPRIEPHRPIPSDVCQMLGRFCQTRYGGGVTLRDKWREGGRGGGKDNERGRRGREEGHRRSRRDRTRPKARTRRRTQVGPSALPPGGGAGGNCRFRASRRRGRRRKTRPQAGAEQENFEARTGRRAETVSTRTHAPASRNEARSCCEKGAGGAQRRWSQNGHRENSHTGEHASMRDMTQTDTW